MSKYEDQYDDNYIICPYCKYYYQCEGEDYEESGVEGECPECGKIYVRTTIFEVSHKTEPDCNLNKTNHRWESKKLSNGVHHDFCTICGECRMKSKEYPCF